MSELGLPLPTGYRQGTLTGGEVALVQLPSINGTTAIMFLVSVPFVIVGLVSIFASGMRFDAIGFGVLAIVLGAPMAIVSGRLIFIRRRWLLSPAAITYEIGTWLLPMSVRRSYPGPATIEIRHRLTNDIIRVDIVVIKSASGDEMLIDAADNAPQGCFKVLIWRGLQVGFEYWRTADASRRRPQKLEDFGVKVEPIESSVIDLQEEIAPSVMMLARFLVAATRSTLRVFTEPNRGRLISIGSD
jgi:hypothetical protein